MVSFLGKTHHQQHLTLSVLQDILPPKSSSYSTQSGVGRFHVCQHTFSTPNISISSLSQPLPPTPASPIPSQASTSSSVCSVWMNHTLVMLSLSLTATCPSTLSPILVQRWISDSPARTAWSGAMNFSSTNISTRILFCIYRAPIHR